MEKKGVVFHLSSGVKKLSQGVVTFEKDGRIDVAAYDKALLCVGRRPNSAIEGLEELGVKTERGAIVTDEHMQTTVPRYLRYRRRERKSDAGSCGIQRGRSGSQSYPRQRGFHELRCSLGVVYTNPEAAFVGMSEEQAKASGIPYKVKKVSINFSGRHIAENGMSNGLCKLIINTEKNTLTGAALMSSYASEYIYALALMIDLQLPLERVTRTIFPHPTVCEIIREALLS